MIHQPLGGASGAAVDIEIQAKEIMYHKANLNRIMSEYTGQPIDKARASRGATGARGAEPARARLTLPPPVARTQIEEDTDRDRYMSPLEAKAYGLIDNIVGGDEAVFKVEGSTRAFPKTKEQYVNWGDYNELDGSRGARFVKPLEPHTDKVETSRS